jgi:hypothetical protein
MAATTTFQRLDAQDRELAEIRQDLRRVLDRLTVIETEARIAKWVLRIIAAAAAALVSKLTFWHH